MLSSFGGVLSPETVLDDESAESEEATDHQCNTDVGSIFLEHISESFDTVLGRRSISHGLQEPEETNFTDTIAVHLIF
jgi:hypothetical protein